MTETEVKYQHLLRIMARQEQEDRARREAKRAKPQVAIAA